MSLIGKLALPFLVLLALSLLTVGCGSSNNAQVRFMNASPGEPTLSALLNNNSLASGVAYGTASSYTSIATGTPTLLVEVPGSATSLIDESITLNSGTTYTVIASNYAANIGLGIYTDNNSAPTSGDVNVRVINSAPGLGTVDVYIVAPGTNLNTIGPTITGLAFNAASAYQTLTANNYEVYFTSTGQKFAYIDSGPLTWGAGQVRTVVGLNGASSGYTDTVLDDLN